MKWRSKSSGLHQQGRREVCADALGSAPREVTQICTITGVAPGVATAAAAAATAAGASR